MIVIKDAKHYDEYLMLFYNKSKIIILDEVFFIEHLEMIDNKLHIKLAQLQLFDDTHKLLK